MKKIRVLIIDESVQSRNMLAQIVDSQADMETVGRAASLLPAREMARSLSPDVLILDVNAARLAEMRSVENFLQRHLLPVVVISPFAQTEFDTALKDYAFAYVQKADFPHNSPSFAHKIADKVRLATTLKLPEPKKMTVAPCYGADVILPLNPAPASGAEKLIIVGASTGGTEAIRDFLLGMPPRVPGILIAQHMPETFTKSFADRLDALCKITVREAVDGERVMPGHAYIAPGHSHLLLKKVGSSYFTELNPGMPVNRHRPSVDVLFRSAANCAGKNAVGVILTGMGKDGAVGLLEMKQAGSYNFAQDEASCVVFGMPREAILLGAADEVVPLSEMAARVLHHLSI